MGQQNWHPSSEPALHSSSVIPVPFKACRGADAGCLASGKELKLISANLLNSLLSSFPGCNYNPWKVVPRSKHTKGKYEISFSALS